MTEHLVILDLLMRLPANVCHWIDVGQGHDRYGSIGAKIDYNCIDIYLPPLNET